MLIIVLNVMVICGILYFLLILFKNLGICLFFFIVCNICLVMVIKEILVLNGDIIVFI